MIAGSDKGRDGMVVVRVMGNVRVSSVTYCEIRIYFLPYEGHSNS